eukprot:Tamp_16926.p1 GENE.Tamp_16926~~Tamp_16926.p1  ORF type:complete len:433 (-),score=80.52 Tamp_16926:128-1345(-)
MHALGDAVERQCADLGRRADADPALFRCLQLLRRLGRRRAGDDAWRAAFGRAVSRLTWGMPGCPVERKVEAGGGAMACNNIGEALGAYAHRPLLMHIVNDAMDWQHFDTGAVLACPHKCLWAGAVEPPGLADVFVYDCLQQPPRGGHTGRQALMLLCMESAAHLPRLEDPNFLRRFDITATYRRDSQVPLLYAPGNTSLYAYGHAHASPHNKEGRAAVIWVASNCAPARQDFVASLMHHLPVDSYGKCLHNTDFPALEELVFGSPKLPLFARYKFALALENSLAHDYVTEKFYQPLLAGAVPIYLGAPNIEEFAPDADAYIDLRRFASIEALASHLTHLSQDNAAYAKLHAWRHRPLPDHMQRHARLAFNQAQFYGEQDMRQDPCRLCQAAHAHVWRQPAAFTAV